MRASKISNINFFEDLTSPFARKRFCWAFGSLLAGCLVLFFLINGLTKSAATDAASSIIIEVAAGAFIILFFYITYMHLIGPHVKSSDLRSLRAQDINKEVKLLSSNTTTYMFWGRSGSFLRAYTLLELNRQARVKQHNIRIEVILPNPEGERLVDSYNKILQSLGENKEKNTLLLHVIATCLVCAILEANNRHLEIEIYLSHFLPNFRLDLSDKGAILTHDDRTKPALHFGKESEFYEMFRGTIINERDVSRRVIWDRNLFNGLGLVESSCNEVTITAFGVDNPGLDEIQERVAKLVTERPHRYK